MEKTTKERDQDIVDMLWQRETFYRCNEDGSFSKVDLVNEFYDDIQQELSKAREEGRREGGQAFLRDTLSYCSFHNGKPRRLGDVEIMARKLSKLNNK